MRLAVVAHVPPPFGVGLGEGAGAWHRPVASHDGEVRIGAYHGQGSRQRRFQPPGVVGQPFGLVVEEPGGEHEVRVLHVVHQLERQSLDQAPIPFRTDQPAAFPERGVPVVVAPRQRVAGDVARGDHPFVPVVPDPHFPEPPDDVAAGPGRVGQQENARPAVAKTIQAVRNAGIGRHAVVDEPPQVENHRFVPRREGRHALEDGNRHRRSVNVDTLEPLSF